MINVILQYISLSDACSKLKTKYENAEKCKEIVIISSCIGGAGALVSGKRGAIIISEISVYDMYAKIIQQLELYLKSQDIKDAIAKYIEKELKECNKMLRATAGIFDILKYSFNCSIPLIKVVSVFSNAFTVYEFGLLFLRFIYDFNDSSNPCGDLSIASLCHYLENCLSNIAEMEKIREESMQALINKNFSDYKEEAEKLYPLNERVNDYYYKEKSKLNLNTLFERNRTSINKSLHL